MSNEKRVRIPLENDTEFAVVDAEDYPRLSKYKWFAVLVMVSLTNSQYADARHMPMSWVYVSLPLAGLLMIFFVVERSLQPKR